jgi:hypothetical protein
MLVWIWLHFSLANLSKLSRLCEDDIPIEDPLKTH